MHLYWNTNETFETQPPSGPYSVKLVLILKDIGKELSIEYWLVCDSLAGEKANTFMVLAMCN